jgi:hypothetical protein
MDTIYSIYQISKELCNPNNQKVPIRLEVRNDIPYKIYIKEEKEEKIILVFTSDDIFVIEERNKTETRFKENMLKQVIKSLDLKIERYKLYDENSKIIIGPFYYNFYY